MSFAVRRGTTPTIKIKVLNLSLDDADCYMTFKQKGVTPVTRRHARADGNIASAILTQQETLALKDSERTGKPLEVQLRFYKNGRAFATEIFELEVEDALLEEVIPLGD